MLKCRWLPVTAARRPRDPLHGRPIIQTCPDVVCADVSIYQAAENVGIKLPASCLMGSCTSCCGKVLSGATIAQRRRRLASSLCKVACQFQGFSGFACAGAVRDGPAPGQTALLIIPRRHLPARPLTISAGKVSTKGQTCIPPGLAKEGYVAMCCATPTSDVRILTNQVSWGWRVPTMQAAVVGGPHGVKCGPLLGAAAEVNRPILPSPSGRRAARCASSGARKRRPNTAEAPARPLPHS